ncbi:MAG: hypothetical protein DMF61_26980 [Blastocatellia bacterium AA13]|nr:MAG: hypothetical protein DMF61_26980 [Blastocatellia bacterium AA13]
MNTHLSAKEIKGYIARTVSRQVFDKVSDHVYNCEVCYQEFLAELQKGFPIEIDFAEIGGRRDWHLSEQELKAFVKGRMDELDFECANLHLEECDSCLERAAAVAERKSPLHGLFNWFTDRVSLWTLSSVALKTVGRYRWRLVSVVLLIGLFLMLWALLQPPRQTPQIVGAPSRVEDQAAQGGSSNPEPLPRTNYEAHIPRQDEKPRGEPRTITALTMPAAIGALDKMTSVTVRGAGSEVVTPSFSVIHPFATLVAENQPIFSWTSLEGATNYTVFVYDAALHLLVESEPLFSTNWLMPEPLKEGNHLYLDCKGHQRRKDSLRPRTAGAG